MASKGLRTAFHHRAGQYLNPALGFLASIWVTHAILRCFLLFRKDAFGFPFVGKPDWYIFHAFAIDDLWITLWSLPFLILLMATRFLQWKKAAQGIFAALMFFHGTILLFTVADHETLRFMGMHLDLSMLATYGNASAGREVVTFVASDASVPYLSFLLFFACVPVAGLLYFRYFRNRFWTRNKIWNPLPLWIFGGCAVFSFVFLNFIWTGGFRMLKLRAFPATVMASLGSQHRKSSMIPLGELSREFQTQWQREQGDSTFVFPDTSYPFYKVPRVDSIVKPKKPVNFILILMESHRGVNVGYLKPFGATVDATPVMDSLARGKAHAWTRFACSGIPTINALMSVHLSILQHPSRYIASDFALLRHRAFTNVLGRHGYRTHFFSAADPSWDGQVPWLRQWYQGITYDRSRETDGAMFQDMAKWMKDSLSTKSPFMVTAMTKTNHYPFNFEPGVKKLAHGATLQEKMIATMQYTDASVGHFLESISHEPWYENTVILLLADHGFPLSEHGSSTIGFGLYNESVWIPFLMIGNQLRMGSPALHDYPASQVDIAPTVLALAGICESNHFIGHDLFRPATGKNSMSYLVRSEQGSLETGFRISDDSVVYFRLHGPIGMAPREQGNEIFNTISDRQERKNEIIGKGKAVYDSLQPYLKHIADLNTYVVEANALWPDTSVELPKATSPLH